MSVDTPGGIPCGVAEQVLQCVTFAAGYRMYPPPEYVAVDEGVPGSRRLEGLSRIQAIIHRGVVQVLLVRPFSRMFRSLLVGCTLIDEMVVQAGLRAVGVIESRDDIVAMMS